MTVTWIDISVPIYRGMVHWPDNPAVRIENIQDLSRGDAATVSKLELGAHTGTHMDAPKHFLADGAGLDDMPLDASIGPARVISIAHPQVILPAELEAHRLQAGERVLFHTRNSERCWKNDQFVEDFVYISAAAAQFLVQRQVRTVGIDYLSVGGYVHDAVETHRILLGAGIWLIEGLNLSAVKPGAYELVCLPLRVAGADGAPARAILRPRGQ
ncbi:MAG: cyclase family protein [Candidatus Manganitrophus sp.]|nr:MAG: cyclase family protein [Candidatus Manganitrophus sp.]WDT80784.1 MAG: cyclase family protein [Candidatus Manganitrophus sp.]